MTGVVKSATGRCLITNCCLKGSCHSLIDNSAQSTGPGVRDRHGRNGSSSNPRHRVSVPRSHGEQGSGAGARRGVPQEHRIDGAQSSDRMMAHASVRPPFRGRQQGFREGGSLCPLPPIEGRQASPQEDDSIPNVRGDPVSGF